VNEYEVEPIRGLPAPLPAGEELLWQGAPRWQSLARRAFQLRGLALYFGVLLLWRIGSAWADGHAWAALALSTLSLTLAALAAVGLLALLAWLVGRTTVYTITSRRIVIRFGIALPLTLNIPLRIVESAAFKAYADGTGDIPLSLTGAERVGYLILWPHVRPRRLAKPQPMLRAVPDAAAVAEILVQALAPTPATSVVSPPHAAAA
jgi:hypothetical protein